MKKLLFMVLLAPLFVMAQDCAPNLPDDFPYVQEYCGLETVVFPDVLSIPAEIDSSFISINYWILEENWSVSFELDIEVEPDVFETLTFTNDEFGSHLEVIWLDCDAEFTIRKISGFEDVDNAGIVFNGDYIESDCLDFNWSPEILECDGQIVCIPPPPPNAWGDWSICSGGTGTFDDQLTDFGVEFTPDTYGTYVLCFNPWCWSSNEFIEFEITFLTEGCEESSPGCMDSEACNFDPDANIEDGSCLYGFANIIDIQLESETMYTTYIEVDLGGDAGNIESIEQTPLVCLDLYYSFAWDLSIHLIPPGGGNGVSILPTGGCNSVTLGEWGPDGTSEGYQYCWAHDSSNGVLCDGLGWNDTAPPGIYEEYGIEGFMFEDLVGSPIEGVWTLTIGSISNESAENGHLFNWSLDFPSEETVGCQNTIQGCADEHACNFNPEANLEDNSCSYSCFDFDVDAIEPEFGTEDYNSCSPAYFNLQSFAITMNDGSDFPENGTIMMLVNGVEYAEVTGLDGVLLDFIGDYYIEFSVALSELQEDPIVLDFTVFGELFELPETPEIYEEFGTFYCSNCNDDYNYYWYFQGDNLGPMDSFTPSESGDLWLVAVNGACEEPSDFVDFIYLGQYGCIEECACNYDSDADFDDGSCEDFSCMTFNFGFMESEEYCDSTVVSVYVADLQPACATVTIGGGGLTFENLQFGDTIQWTTYEPGVYSLWANTFDVDGNFYGQTFDYLYYYEVIGSPESPTIAQDGEECVCLDCGIGYSLAWYLDGALASTETTFIPPNNGEVYLVITDLETGCTSQSEVIDHVVGIEDYQIENFEVLGNGTSRLTIVSKANELMKVFDVSGKLMHEVRLQHGQQYEFGDLPSGHYVVRVGVTSTQIHIIK